MHEFVKLQYHSTDAASSASSTIVIWFEVMVHVYMLCTVIVRSYSLTYNSWQIDNLSYQIPFNPIRLDSKGVTSNF